MTDIYQNLPDPQYQPEFYADIPVKRLLAWVIDSILIGVLSLIVVLFTGFIAAFFLPLTILVISMAYRVVSLANRSATPGMRVLAIELRKNDGSTFDLTTATLHTGLYLFFTSIFIGQVVSIVLMLTDARARGLPDIILGTVALNRAARA